ncbi:lipopolysaccharide biosynthesis protein [Bordetella genomosp. 13]|uniref:lipopolysaccharide biosynthesis protein n=1 Tax=Bordetella genomosp. 13 TaxID=463040 RepID=UPI001642F50A|nr:hypothetical protein [Bordetella genomosp. 13]
MPTASPRPRLWFSAMVSIVDQAWLSMLNLAVGLILIRLVAKEDYGTYAQLYVAGLFAAGITEALVSNPLTTLASRYPDDQRATMMAHMDRFQSRLGTWVAVLFGVACAGVAGLLDLAQPLWLGLGFALYVKTNATREYRRSTLFIEGASRRVLALDLRYGVAVLACTGVLIWAGWLTIPAVFAVLGAGNLVALLGAPRHPVPGPGAVPSYPEAVRESWKRGRLGLPGSILAWVINYSYLYVVAAWLGATATADLNASRLLLMPISLSVQAWSRVARPLIGRLLAGHDRARLRRLLFGSVVGIELLTISYVLVLWLALPWLQHHVLGEKYANVQALVLIWGAYFAINAARWIGTAALMSADRYDNTLTIAFVSLTLILTSMNVLIPLYGTEGAILSLAFVEVVSLFLNWWFYWRTLRSTETPQ